MRIFAVVVAATLTGVALGYAATVAEFGFSMREPQLTAQKIPPFDAQEKNNHAKDQPRLVVDEPKHFFDRMFQNKTGSHTFVLRNEGTADLKIVPGKPSCKCAVSKVSRKTIPPGKTAEVTLTWKTGKSKGRFRKSVPITSNDPRQSRIRLQINGTITPEFLFKPPSIFASSVSHNTSSNFESKLYFYSHPDAKITSDNVSNPQMSEQFAIHYEPISNKDIKEPYAVCGYTVRITILSGMEFGGFHEAIVFDTEPAMKTPVRLNINGTVRKPINIFGPYLNPKTQTLTMGDVPEGLGKRMRLIMHTSGEHSKDVQLKLKESVPKTLQIETGPGKDLSRGMIHQTPLNIILPPTAEACDYSGDTPDQMGRIVLTTNHPDYPEITLHVKLTVKPKENAELKDEPEKSDN